MITAIKTISYSVSQAGRSALKAARRAYHVAAFASFMLVAFTGWQAAHGKLVQFDGVAHAELPFGNPQQAMIAQLPADQVLPVSFAMPPTNVADARHPAQKPPVPPAAVR